MTMAPTWAEPPPWRSGGTCGRRVRVRRQVPTLVPISGAGPAATPRRVRETTEPLHSGSRRLSSVWEHPSSGPPTSGNGRATDLSGRPRATETPICRGVRSWRSGHLGGGCPEASWSQGAVLESLKVVSVAVEQHPAQQRRPAPGSSTRCQSSAPPGTSVDASCLLLGGSFRPRRPRRSRGAPAVRYGPSTEVSHSLWWWGLLWQRGCRDGTAIPRVRRSGVRRG